MFEISMSIEPETTTKERRIQTIFDLISLVAGVPNLLTILVMMNISKYLDFHANFSIAEKITHNEKEEKEGTSASIWLKLKLYLLNKGGFIKKIFCCVNEKSRKL